MRVLVFGADGMLGHQLMRHLQARHEVRGTVRRALAEYGPEVRALGALRGGVDVRREADVDAALEAFAPEAVVNAAGIVKQRDEAKAAIASIEVNALFPQRLAAWCAARRVRLVHFSTDCVFSGAKGMYSERDEPDPVDLYGRSKLLGEPAAAGCLTLRTSMIGTELSRKTGLLEWFLAQERGGPGASVSGYRKAVFSGLTTPELARVTGRLLEDGRSIEGLYHLSAAPITKFDLLTMIKDRLKMDIALRPDDRVTIDRSLDSRRLREALGYQPPSWAAMIDELAAGLGAGAR